MERHYTQRATELRAGKIKTRRDLLNSMSGVIPGDAEFEATFATLRVPKTNIARYYLSVLEQHVGGQSDPELVTNPDVAAVNLEHILPQNPSASWGINPDDAKALVRRLGNMVLLRTKRNTRLGNADFATKKVEYAKSDMKLTKEIDNYKNWGPQEIADRQAAMAKLAVKAWPLM